MKTDYFENVANQSLIIIYIMGSIKRKSMEQFDNDVAVYNADSDLVMCKTIILLETFQKK